MLLADWEIRALCVESEWNEVGYTLRTGWTGTVQMPDGFQPMLDPFSEAVSGDGVVSYGLTSAGYDLRLADELWVSKNTHGIAVDVRRMKDPGYTDKIYDRIEFQDDFDVPPGTHVLGRALERICMPRHLVGHVVGKSTLARAGIIINVTTLEPMWQGYLTIEIFNSSLSPVKILANQGIAQLHFELIHRDVETDYAEKGGRYQNQVGVTPGFVK